MLIDIAHYAVDGLMRRSLRSWLTIVGIVIGIMAIVLLVALGQGIDKAVRDQLSFFGDDVMQVVPGGSQSAISFIAPTGALTEKDWKDVQQVPGVDIATPYLGDRLNVQFKEETATLMVSGLRSDFLKVYTAFEIGEGRANKEGERGVAVVGNKFAYDFWGTPKRRESARLGSRIIVENRSFTVIGILKPAGGGIMAVADSGVYLTYEDARSIVPAAIGNDQIQELEVKLLPGADPKAVEAGIKQVMDRNHKIKSPEERDYSVITSEQVKNTVGSITGALTAFLLAVATVSLVVGSIGVANTMFMSVLERTREIGILKAIGASESTIQTIFLLESGLIGTVGGGLGLAVGFVMVEILRTAASLFGINLPIYVGFPLAIGALLVAFVIGVIAGYFPARRAAGFQAVESLRYE